MLRLTFAILAVALAGTASAAGWRSLRIDGSSEEAFNESVVEFRAKLPYVRQQVFERSLQDIWVEGTKTAQAEGRDYTISDYLHDLDALKYRQVVTFTDPSGDTADRYWDQAYASLFPDRVMSRPRQTGFGPNTGGVGGPKNGPTSFPNWN